MRETDADLARLQDLLDRSIAGAGAHLREVITPEHRLDAAAVCERLQGMCLLSLATVTADRRPLVGPVDGIFFRGEFHFASSPASVRMRHIGRRPSVSATHLPGEHLQVTVHGRAERIDMRDPANRELREVVLGIYTPRYGPEWEEFMDRAAYARIHADRMFTFAMDPEAR